MRGTIEDRSGPTGPAYRVRLRTPSGRITRLVRWDGPPPSSKTEAARARRVTSARAEQLLTRLLAELDDGAHSGPDATITTLLARWIRARSPNWSPAAELNHRRIADSRITPYIGTVHVADLTVDRIDDLYATLSKEGGRDGRPLAAGTVLRVHSALHSALGQAVDWGWIVRNPADRAHPPRPHRGDPDPPDPDAVKAVLTAARSDAMVTTYLILAAATGARRGELCALRWSDLDWDRHQVRIARAISIGVGGLVEQDRTKTAGGGRTIALGPGCWHALKAWREAIDSLDGNTTTGFLFATTPDGSVPTRPEWHTNRLRRIAVAAGHPEVTVLQLRHAAATQALARGVPVHTVSARLGHARTSTTLDIYGHAIDAHDGEAAELLDQLYAT